MERIKVGDEVLSFNQKTGTKEYKEVTDLTPPHKDHLVELQIAGELGVLRPSTDHPFWVKRSPSDAGHWIEAGNLRPGELVETIQGAWRKIESVTYEQGWQTVYNFTVANDHDYFVGQTGFLVHNAGPCGCTDPPAWITPGSLPPDEENLLLDTLSHIDNGTVPTGPTGIKWGSPFNNWGTPPYLPGGQGPGFSPYQEYRVGSGGLGAGARRIVHNPATGEAYYTWTHYGQAGCPGFVRIR